jgi:hypothetical protein
MQGKEDMHSNTLTLKKRLINVAVPASQKAQDILNYYRNKSTDASELDRVLLAKSLCKAWKNEKISFVLPAVVERNDYWYLVQLFFLGRHVHYDGNLYKTDFSKSEKLLIDSYEEKDYEKMTIDKKSLLGQLFSISNIKVNKDVKAISRKTLDGLIKNYGNLLILKLNLDPKMFKLIPIPFDIYIRLGKKMKFGKHILNTFFDGYRLRTDGRKTALFGGNTQFGGPSFIDSIWTDTVNNSIIPRLIIIRKDYGRL